MNKEKSKLVCIGTWERLLEFIKIVSSFDSDINIYYGSNYYDAKSFMSILSLGILEKRYVEIVSDNEDEIKRFNEEMEEFRVWEK